MKKKKYFAGGAIDPITAFISIAGMASTLVPPNVRGRQEDAQAMSGMQDFNKFGYAQGGQMQTPVMPQDPSMIEDLDAGMMQFNGPSHEQGGIPTSGGEVESQENIVMPEVAGNSLPYVLSDRVKIDKRLIKQFPSLSRYKNKTLAAAADLAKKDLESGSKDVVTRKGAERNYQNTLAQLMQANESKLSKKDIKARQDTFRDGGNIKPFKPNPTPNPYLTGQLNWNGPLSPISNTLPSLATNPIAPTTALPLGNPSTVNRPVTNQGGGMGSPGFNFNTLGNKIGAAGSAISAFGPLLTTLSNGIDRDETNEFLNVSSRAEDTLSQNMGRGKMRAEDRIQLQSNAIRQSLQANSQTASQRNSRLQSLATNTQRNIADSNLQYDTNEANAMSQLQFRGDVLSAQGETARLDRLDQNRDNFYTNLSANLSNIGSQIQAYGGQKNKELENQQKFDTLESANFQVQFDPVTGKFIPKFK